MRVLCAWCLKEGKPEAEALIGEKEPREDQQDSHGICPHHRQEVEARMTALREEIRREAQRREEEARRVRERAERQRAEVEELRQRVDP